MHTSVESLVPNAPPSLVGAIEAGGTKFVCAIGIGPDAGLRARQQFPTGDNPERLLADEVTRRDLRNSPSFLNRHPLIS